MEPAAQRQGLVNRHFEIAAGYWKAIYEERTSLRGDPPEATSYRPQLDRRVGAARRNDRSRDRVWGRLDLGCVGGAGLRGDRNGQR
jgi:hypothetical protein